MAEAELSTSNVEALDALLREESGWPRQKRKTSLLGYVVGHLVLS